MEKLKFKTVGQFLVALEEGPLYCGERDKFVINTTGDIITVKSLQTGSEANYSSFLSFVEFMKEREFTRKPLPQDKDLVWCWDNDHKFCRVACFYSAKYDRVFTGVEGLCHGASYDNYEVIPKKP